MSDLRDGGCLCQSEAQHRKLENLPYPERKGYALAMGGIIEELKTVKDMYGNDLTYADSFGTPRSKDHFLSKAIPSTRQPDRQPVCSDEETEEKEPVEVSHKCEETLVSNAAL